MQQCKRHLGYSFPLSPHAIAMLHLERDGLHALDVTDVDVVVIVVAASVDVVDKSLPM